jgi:hypothetical protein
MDGMNQRRSLDGAGAVVMGAAPFVSKPQGFARSDRGRGADVMRAAAGGQARKSCKSYTVPLPIRRSSVFTKALFCGNAIGEYAATPQVER